MYKKFLTVLFFVLITSPVFSAGGDGGGSGGDGGGAGETKPVSQYEIAVKMIKKAKKFEKKKKIEGAKTLQKSY